MSQNAPPSAYRHRGIRTARSVSSLRSLGNIDEPSSVVAGNPHYQRRVDYLVLPEDSISNIDSISPSSPTLIEYPYPRTSEYSRGLPKDDGKIYINLPRPTVLAHRTHSDGPTSKLSRSTCLGINGSAPRGVRGSDTAPSWNEPRTSEYNPSIVRPPSAPPASHTSFNSQNLARIPIHNGTALIQWTATRSETHTSSPASLSSPHRISGTPGSLHAISPISSHRSTPHYSPELDRAPSSVGRFQSYPSPHSISYPSHGGPEVMQTALAGSPLMPPIPPGHPSSAKFSDLDFPHANDGFPPIPHLLDTTQVGPCLPESPGHGLLDTTSYRRKEKAGRSKPRVQVYTNVVVVTPGEGQTARLLTSGQHGGAPIISIEDSGNKKKAKKKCDKLDNSAEQTKEKPKWWSSKKTQI